MKSLRQFIFLFILLLTSTHVNAQGDECTGAAELTNLNKYCSNAKQYTNVSATPAMNGLAIPACFNTGATYDVWFKFTAIGTDLQLSVSGGGTNGTIKKPNIALYSGNCTSTLFELACSPASTDATTLYKGSLVSGTTYLIRISTTSANRGTFMLCISNFTPTVNPGADCDGASQLCDTSFVIVPGLSGGGKNNKEIESASCFYSPGDPNTLIEANSSWFKWKCDKAGTLIFDITPVDPANDIDFVLYEITGTDGNVCGPRTILRCSATSCIKGPNGLNLTETDLMEAVNCNTPMGNGYLKYLDMVSGKTYALLVSNFSAASGFSIKFGGTGTFLSGGKSTPVITAYDSATCAKNTITFTGSFSTKYKSLDWTFPSGLPSKASSVGPVTVRYNTPGAYPVYLKTTDSACTTKSSVDSVKVIIHPLPGIDTSSMVITNSINGASNGSITGIHSDGKNFKWYKVPAALVFNSDSTADLLAQPAGKYYLVVTDNYSCTDTSAVFEIKNEIPTAVDPKTAIDNFTLSPNPTSGFIDLRFHLKEVTSVEVELNNVLGQSLSREVIKSSTDTMYYRFDLSNQNPGIYFVKVTYGNNTVVKRIVRQ